VFNYISTRKKKQKNMSGRYTLDNAEQWGLQLGQPSDYRPGQFMQSFDFRDPIGGSKQRDMSINAMTNDPVDLRAPGIRDQINAPTFPFFGPTRTSLFDRNTSINNAPVPQWDQGLPSFLETEQNQRWNAKMYRVCQDTPTIEHWAFRDYGQFNVPYTGFSAFSDLRPVSTMAWL